METAAMCALLIVVVAGVALLITTVGYQVRLLTGHAAGPMLPITLTTACVLGTIALGCALLHPKRKAKLIFLILAATMITIIALAACCYRGVFSTKIFAKATLITLGSPLVLGWLTDPCICYH